MSDLTETIDTYIAMWNEPDPQRRAQLIERAWAPKDARYADPVQEADGHTALSDMVAAIHERFPGQRFRRTSAIDVHHETARFGWELGVPDGEVTVGGIDVAVLDADGRLQRISGFFGEVPQEEAAA